MPRWINTTDLWINSEEEDPDKRIMFRQVGWLGHTGEFYKIGEKLTPAERGGFSPIYIQISQ